MAGSDKKAKLKQNYFIHSRKHVGELSRGQLTKRMKGNRYTQGCDNGMIAQRSVYIGEGDYWEKYPLTLINRMQNTFFRIIN